MKVDYLLYQNTKQLTDSVIMIKPANFGFNKETAENNAFQSSEGKLTPEEIKEKAIKEFDEVVNKLTKVGINVQVIEDTAEPVKTDAVFPNNWLSTHENGVMVTYAMFAPSRRAERRTDILEGLERDFVVHKHYSFDFYEDDGQYLEGTGSMILDRKNKILYSCLSPRTEARVLEKFAVLMSYSKVVFHAMDKNGDAIYHTNVMMALGTDFAVVCMETIENDVERKDIISSLKRTGKEIIEITEEQMKSFAGNMLQLSSNDGKSYLLMSSQAYKSLDPDQIERISSYTDIIKASIPTIEKYGGGSVRCMVAENFLTSKNKTT